MFKNANGELSIYSLNCGYIQTCKNDNFEMRLYKDGCYHIRIGSIWLSCNRLTPLRYIYQCIEKRIKDNTAEINYINGWSEEIGLYA